MSLKGIRIAILLEQMYEDLELWYPYYRLKEEGAEVHLVAPVAGQEYPSKHGYPAKCDRAVDAVSPKDYGGVVIPGGFSPDHMRRTPAMVEFVKDMARQSKPVAAICHGGWMLASAGVLKGRKATSFFAIRDDLRNAGAEWVDQEVVVDGNLITSRFPADLPVFVRTFLDALAGKGTRQPARSA